MEVVRFVDQYEPTAALLGMTSEELRVRDEGQGPPPQRWIAVQSKEVVGAVTAWLRPDARMFLSFVVEAPEAYGPLTREVDGALRRHLYTMGDESDVAMVEALQGAGFRTEMVGERFRVRFDSALRSVNRAWVPTGYQLRSASDVDEARLFTLDNTIRSLVPGTDGWHGDAEWFHDELMESPPYDPEAYLVAVHTGSDEYVGLVRIWRNPDGPRLGLVGVLPQHRSQPVAAALLKQALTAAAGWGYETFTTETSPSNRATYPRMSRMDAERMGRFIQFMRPTSASP